MAFNETAEVAKTKEWLLNAVRAEKVSPSADSYNYASAYLALVNAEVAKGKLVIEQDAAKKK